MPRIVRHRTALVWLAPLIVLWLLWATDPDGGASTKIWLLRIATATLVYGVVHWFRKASFDYPEADMQRLFAEARKSPTGAGLALIALAIIISALLAIVGGNARAADLYPAAQQYLPMLKAERERAWPQHPQPELLAAQIDHETACPRPSMCWKPTARLKSAREEGAGFGQFTRTWRADGTQRFDALGELTQRHPALADLSWENVYQRPDLQLRAFLLKTLDDSRTFAAVSDPSERIVFGLVAHNRGAGGVQAERRACKIAPGCDPGRWFRHVELHCTASRAALYGSRSACDISRNYPRDIIARAPKYRGLV